MSTTAERIGNLYGTLGSKGASGILVIATVSIEEIASFILFECPCNHTHYYYGKGFCHITSWYSVIISIVNLQKPQKSMLFIRSSISFIYPWFYNSAKILETDDRSFEKKKSLIRIFESWKRTWLGSLWRYFKK